MTSVAYLGPAGTWSHIALLADPVASTADRVPTATIPEAIEAVERGEADYAVVPIQNSIEGGVNATIDTLLRLPVLRIVGESTVDVHHCLIAAPGTTFQDVSVVASHPQATAQCREFLRRELPGVPVHTVSSTAQAIREAVDADDGHAGLGPAQAAALYGGEILRADVEDEADNVTRFVWVARSDGAVAPDPWPAPDGPRWRTSVVFWGQGDGTPGWLVRCLSEFSERGLNMSRIESRPRRGRLERYVFFVDLDGRGDSPEMVAALDALALRCASVRVLGAYPAA